MILSAACKSCLDAPLQTYIRCACTSRPHCTASLLRAGVWLCIQQSPGPCRLQIWGVWAYAISCIDRVYETIECALESDFRCGFRPILIRTPGYFPRRVADVPVQDATAGETADAANPGAISWPRTPAAPTPRHMLARGPTLATRVGGQLQ